MSNFLIGCQENKDVSNNEVSGSYTYPTESANSEQDNELEDGLHDCEAENITRSNGPYSLECEKLGMELTIHFNNGGYITNDINSQNKVGDHAWEIDTSNPENGDNWTVEISK
jgi:hypothetical protein